jgi:hypothetical protein
LTGAITITILQDAAEEADETVVVTMGTPTNAFAQGTTQHTATISDDDTPEIHDVAVTSLSASPNPVGRGKKVTFTYKVKNLGNETEYDVVFRLMNGSQPVGRPRTIPSLDPGEEQSYSTNVTVPRKAPLGEYTITGSVDFVTGETLTDNNSKTVKVTVK